jgi:hypothetical protein
MGQYAEGSRVKPPNARRADRAPARHHEKRASKILHPARKGFDYDAFAKNIISASTGYRWALWTCILESRHRDVRSDFSTGHPDRNAGVRAAARLAAGKRPSMVVRQNAPAPR